MDNGNIPIALVTEKRPPTQSQNPNTYLIPKDSVLSKLVEQAQKCFEITSYSLIPKVTKFYLERLVKSII